MQMNDEVDRYLSIYDNGDTFSYHRLSKCY